MNNLLYVSPEVAAIYKSKSDKMLEEVNRIMTDKTLKFRLIGTNALTVMYNNHRNHVTFMGSLFQTNDYSMLDKTLPWILHTYLTKGFSISYFSHVLETWMDVIRQNMDESACSQILPVYKFMLDSIESDSIVIKAGGTAKNANVDKLTRLLINGRHLEAMELVKSFITDSKTLMETYIGLIQPTMYKVGSLWESNEITVSHEHLATSLIMRIMSSLYEDYVLRTPEKYKIVMAASLNEFHEIGARIAADFLEMHGYDIRYLGSNIPVDDLIEILKDERPSVLGLSVSMSYNIGALIDVIKAIRNVQELSKMKIMVGGYAFSYVSTETLREIDVSVPENVYSMLEICDEWYKEIA